jgi:diacylglycerol kinase family enzyme
LARALGIPGRLNAATAHLTRALERNTVREITLGRANGRRFASSAGIGLDAEFVRVWDRLDYHSNGKRPGDVAYLLAVVKLMRERRWLAPDVMHIRGWGRAAFALVANHDPQTYLGPFALHFAPAARFEAGLDLLAARNVTGRLLTQLMFRAQTARGHPPSNGVIYWHDCDEVEVECDHPTAMHADGEDLGDAETVVFESERAAARLIV